MPQTLYYAQLDDEYFGPFSLETIADMHLTPDVSILSTDTNQWKQAGEYPELIDSLDLSLYEIDEEDSTDENITPPHRDLRVAPSFNERSIFYIRRGGSPYGPYNLEALASVSLSEETDISLDGMTSWFKVYQIHGLLNTLEAIANMENTPEEPQQPVKPTSQDNNEEISEILNRIQGLVPSKKQLFRRVFSTQESERDFIISEYNRVFSTLLNLVKNLSDLCSNASLTRRAVALITSTVNSVASKINNHYVSEINRMNVNKNEFTTSSVSIGQTNFSLLPPLENVEITRIDFLTVLGNKNLCVTYDAESENKAVDFVNSIIGKLYETNPARLIVTNVIDTDFMTGLHDSFKLLNRELYKVISRTDDVRTTLTSLHERASTFLRNLLVEKDSTLQEYNSTHENKESNILLVLKDFPHGLSTDNLDILKKLANVGPKVGIYIIILTSKEYIDDMAERETEVFDMVKFSEVANSYHFKDNNNILGILKSSDSCDITEGTVEFDNLSESDIKKIVKEVNSKCELNDDVVVSISEYLPETSDWWSFDSAKQIKIPFGIGNDMRVKSLKITQESGQNTAVVIGIPGSGKSVFLHSLICSAAINYSPDELNLYLIDFSGVEFNSYALHNLPHARVIAPEAEREFGLSILNELVEEGARRMELCRNNDVSNIVDLKAKNPSLHIPRLLVIIDEFQKIFEIENDLISREANAKIHTIIQEFRKFGINLVLATQKLPSSSILPKDLIANRVVFKSSPADFSSLISLPINGKVPQLHTGECIYNSESGSPYDNHKVQGFLVTKTDIDKLLNQISEFSDNSHYQRKHDMVVFRGNDLPEFRNRRVARCHQIPSSMPESVGIYLGESISIHETDICAILRKESANNILILGGEPHVAQRIAYYATISASVAHTDQSATFVTLNFMRREDTLNEELQSVFESLPFSSQIVSKTAEIVETLTAIKEEIDERRKDEERPQDHIYLSIYAFQLARMFDKGGRRGDDVSESGMLLDYILKNGPAVGVFTIMQCDNWDNLLRIGNPLSSFRYRIALQMTENDSNKIAGSSIASKLFVFNRPSSVFRAYFRDNNMNINIKFKPYK